MTTLKFEPAGRQVHAGPEDTVMAVAAREGLPVRSDCGGEGICGKCRVILDPPENASSPTGTEQKTLSAGQLSGNVRLACQARVLGPLTVTIPERFMDVDATPGKEIASADGPVNPMVRRIHLSPPSVRPEKKPPGDVVARVTSRLKNALGENTAAGAFESLRQMNLPDITEEGGTVVFHETLGVTAIIRGNAPRSLGLAVDIGTTSVAVYLCDMQSGRVVASDSAANPQRRFGEDVISRISFTGKDSGNTGILQGLAARVISDLARRCAAQASGSTEEIDEVTIAGNPTMQQIFCGADPGNLGRAPFQPLTRQPLTLRAGDAGLSLNPGTPVYVFPVVSGFVGGDTLGAVLADGLHRRRETTLLVDIGTNGEVVVGNRDGLWATSCATGPAFEGARISCGMRAVPGAITRVDMDGVTGEIAWKVMNGRSEAKPMGLCGSGIIDAAAVLRRAGIVLENGRFREDCPDVIYDDQGNGRGYVLVPEKDTGASMPITITLGDIRQLQLAKAALALGIEILTSHAGLAVDRIVLTGAFGARFNWRNAFHIGMLPACVAGAEVFPMDNLAGVGAIRALLDGNARRDMEGLAPLVNHVDLAKIPEFHTGLAKHMSFPNVNDDDGIK